jgi:hypothetical protein
MEAIGLEMVCAHGKFRVPKYLFLDEFIGVLKAWILMLQWHFKIIKVDFIKIWEDIFF